MIYTKLDTEEIKDKLKRILEPERYEHSIGVMETAIELAERFNLDKEKAMTAGLVHDCAKCLSIEEMKKYSFCLDKCELESIKTWHAPIGAVIAEKEYGISSSEILSAVRYHTIGRKDMSAFEKIIYIADKIEKRTRPESMRSRIEGALNRRNSLDDAMLECFKITINSLLERSLPICFQTIDVYNSLIESYKKS